MKKSFIYTLAAVFALAACTKEADVKVPTGETVTIIASVDQTKSTEDHASFSWATDEQISVGTSDDEYVAFEVTDAADAANGLFSHTFTGETPDLLVAVSPVQANADFAGADAYEVELPAVYNNYDPSKGVTNALMIGTPDPNVTNKFLFRHAAALLKITYANVPEGTAGFVLKADKPINTGWSDNNKVLLGGTGVADIEIKNTNSALVQENPTIINLKNAVTEANTTLTFYVPVPTGEYSNLRVSLTGVDGEIASSIKTMDRTGTDKTPLTLNRADVFTFPTITLDPAPEDKYYVKVTSTDGLKDNGQYLIVYEGDATHGAVAFDGSLATLDAASNTKSVEISDNKVLSTSVIDASAFTINVSEGTIKSASELFIGVSSNSNGLKTSSDAATYTNEFSFDNGGNAVIKAAFTGSNMTLRYNYAENQKRFRYYSNNGQQPIALYLLEGTGTAPKTPAGLSYGETTSFTVTYGEPFTAPELINPNNLEVSYASSNPDVATVNQNGEVSIAGVGTTTITASFAGDEVYEAGDAFYTIVVTPAIEAITIAQFLQKTVDTETWYQLTGKITEIANATYGNFYIKDATGSVYVYGLTSVQKTSNDKSFSSLGLKVGDYVTFNTLRSEHSGDPQAGGTVPAYYISHIPAYEVAFSPTEKTVLASDTSIEVSITSNTNWTITSDSGITANPASGNGNQVVTLSFPARTVTGEATLTAVVTADGDSEVTASISITQRGTDYVAPTGWLETDLADIVAGDVFVIVGNNGSDYAMSNNKGTSSGPAAVSVTVSDGKITSTVSNTIRWNLSKGDAGYTFYPVGSTETWLYCTNTNDGVRVGTNANKVFTISNEGYLFNTATSRYVGVYNSNDWRAYTSINANISGQSFKFYKLFGEDPGGDTNPTFKISFTQPTVGGTFTVKVNNTEISSGDEFETGTTVSIKAIPNTNYTFTSWTITGASLSNATLAETSFVIGSSDVTIGASFAAPSVATLPFTYSATGVANNAAITSVDLPTGMSYDTSVPDSNYKCYGGYLGMRKDGCAFIVHFDVAATGISFTGKGQTASNNTMTVAGSVDGVTYTTIQTFSIDESSDTQKTVSEAISSTYRYVKFTFNKNTGNYALKSISITK